MSIVVLTMRKRGRITGREACLLKNEDLTLGGGYPTRRAELEAGGYQVDRVVTDEWPAWVKRGGTR